MIHGETVATGASLPFKGATLTVLRSAAGWFVGYEDEEGMPYSRESRYYRSFELADEALMENSFGRHMAPRAPKVNRPPRPPRTPGSDKTPLQLNVIRMGWENMGGTMGQWTAEQMDYVITLNEDENFSWKDIAIAIDFCWRKAPTESQTAQLMKNAVRAYIEDHRLAKYKTGNLCTFTEWEATHG